MNIPRRTAFFDSPWWLCCCLAALLSLGTLLLTRCMGVARDVSGKPGNFGVVPPVGPDGEEIRFDAGLGETFRPATVVPRSPSIQLARRFRLVGSMAGGVGEAAVWTVILEDGELRRQLRAKPGDEILPDCTVKETGPDFALVSTPDGEQRIGRGGDAASSAGSTPSSRRVAGDGSGNPDGRDSFGGRKIEDNRWEFSRAALMDYYADLLRDHDRLVSVFDSLEPLYGSGGKIEGYTVNILGEADFFQAVGFEQGDIVRTVNGVQMTNRRRAENFIRRVVSEGLDTLIIEIDRGDVAVKNIYETVE